MRVCRGTYTVPRPKGAKVLTRADGKWVRFKNARTREVEGRLSKSGKRVEFSTSHWMIEFVDHAGITRRMKGFTDESSTKRVGVTIEDLINARSSGGGIGPDLQRRIEGLPPGMRKDLAGWGLLDERAMMATKPLTELIELYAESLRAKERSPQHVKQSRAEAMTICEGCGFRLLSDIDAGRIERFLKHRRQDEGISFARSNALLTSMKAFVNWTVREGYISTSPVHHLKQLNVKEDRRRPRRPLEVKELRRLIECTRRAETRYGLTGYERSIVYRLAAETGLRRGDLNKLRVRSFDFGNLTIAVEAKGEKNRKGSILPIRPDTAGELQKYFQGKELDALAFHIPYDTAEMIRADLKDAGIPYVDESGRVADFHALRHTTGSLLAAAGVHPKVAQSIMRHSDINLTMSLYSHTLRGQESDAVASLPNLGLDSRQDQAVATGTDNQKVTSDFLPKSCVADSSHRTLTNPVTQFPASKPRSCSKNAGRAHFSNPSVGGSSPSGRVSEVLKPSPLTKSNKTASVGKDPNLAFHSDSETEIDPDLQVVINQWPRLPDDIRRMVLYVIRNTP